MANIIKINGKDIKDVKATQDIADLKSHIADFAFEYTEASINLNDEEYEYGRFSASGDEYNNDSPITTAFRTKNYLPVTGGKTIEWYGFIDSTNPSALPMQIVQYDSTKTKITTRKEFYRIGLNGQTVRSLTLESNAAYIRFDFTYNGLADFSDALISVYYSENAVEAYTPYFAPTTKTYINYGEIRNSDGVDLNSIINERLYNQFYGKKIAYNGDSICEAASSGGGYAKLISDITGCTYKNDGVSGGHLAVYIDRHVVCTSVSSMPNDADLICFEGGINDYWGNCVIGELTPGYTDTIDNTTLMGALESIFRQAIAKWVGKPICFVIVHKVRGTDTVANANGDTFTDFHDAIIQACNKYSIPYLDMFLSGGMNCNIQTIAQNFTLASTQGEWGVDGCHPNETGYANYYVPKMIDFFAGLLKHN